MRLRQMFLALSLIPAMQMSASAQRAFDEWDETANAPAQARPVETPAASAPVAAPPTERAAAPEMPKRAAPAPVPTPLRIPSANRRYADTYMDAYRILKEENTCSRFFGGAVNATAVLNRFAEQLRNQRFANPNVAVEMSGDYVVVHDSETGAAYRLFERAVVNSAGPLYVRPLPAQAQRRSIGRFPSDTRAARALILLHEIGHLVQGTDRRWLLPNDGHNAELSVRNTETVENYCRQQLTTLKD
ncbi:MAG TPA: hypothetical protein VEZ40_09770 [Pyrinomonadaceae bacterium]|nr:hypothetical protein [Pyrinomonadaceae bacterium]